MLYYSTRHKSPKVTLRDAIMHSGAPDGGLYLPDGIRLMPHAIFNNISEMSINEISYFVANTLFGDDIPSDAIKRIGDETFTFPMPLRKIDRNIYALELFNGPTLTVKDIGARFLARLLSHLNPDPSTPLNVLVATSGNSGAAVANGFHGVEGINVLALHPKSVPSTLVKQFSSLGGNVRSICVNGNIDDCRNMVTQAVTDRELGESIRFTCANTVNIGRVLPKVICYFYAYAQVRELLGKASGLYISVPTGNAGNLMAGYIAKMMGLPVTRLIAACNANGAFDRYLRDGSLRPGGKSAHTLAYAMDTCYPANLPRFESLIRGNIAALRRDIAAGSCTDDEIRRTIKSVYEASGYVLCTHSAVAYKCLKEQLPDDAIGIVMATAHPARSGALVSSIIGSKIELPDDFARLKYTRGQDTPMAPTYPALKKYILNNCQTLL